MNKKGKKKSDFIKKSVLKKVVAFYRTVCVILLIALIILLYFYVNKNDEINVIKKEEIVNPNVLMLGDSITEIYNLNEFYGEDKLIVNSGISGNRVNDILNNMKSRVYAYNPSKIFLLIGINDILWDNADENYIYDKTIEIVDHIHEKLPNTKIYIESIYPYNNEFRNHYSGEAPDYNRVANTIINVNNRLRDYSIEKKYIKYINLYDSLKNENNEFDLRYTDDGLHPNEEGYKVITDILKKYM